MGFADLRTEFVGQSWTATGASVLGGLVIAPTSIGATTVFLELSGLFPGSLEGAVPIFVPPVLLSLFAAEVGGGLLGVGWWESRTSCLRLGSFRVIREETAAPSTLPEMLPFALVLAVIAGTIGYACSAIAARRYHDPSRWVALVYFIVAVPLTDPVLLALYRVVP